MFCPQCYGEYREGFDLCADCDVALVGTLPPEVLLKLERRPGNRFDAFASAVLRHSKEITPVSWLLMFWLCSVAIYWSGEVLTMFMIARNRLSPEAPAVLGVILRAILLALLPLVAAAGIFLQATWARLVCIVSLASATLHSLAMVVALGLFFTKPRSVFSAVPPEVSIWLGLFSGAAAVHFITLLYVYRKGVRGERAVEAA